MDIKSKIPVIKDWPKLGVNFLDINGILQTPEAYDFCISFLCEKSKQFGASSIVAIESRGFLFSSPVALSLNIPLIVVRKPKKLPGKIKTISYETEYSTDSLSIQEDASVGNRPYVIDDLIATGGTFMATTKLLKDNFKGIEEVGTGTIINLSFLPGEKKLSSEGIKLDYLVNYDE